MARSHAASPQSPREKPLDRYEKSENTKRSHHVRRKSGGPRDEKKRPALTRRTTPQHVKTGRRDRDRERDDDAVRDRDGGESFPQFWYVKICFLRAVFSRFCFCFCFFLCLCSLIVFVLGPVLSLLFPGLACPSPQSIYNHHHL